MKSRKVYMAIASTMVLLFMAACVGTNESLKQGREFADQNRWEEAMIYFEKAVSEEPDNQEHQNELTRARQEVAKARLARARQSHAVAGQNFMALERLSKEADEILKLDPNNPEIKSFSATVNGQVNNLKGNLKNLYQQSETDMQKEDWLAAIDKLKQINAIFPNYEDTGNRLRRSLSEGTRAMYQQGIKLAKQEDWKSAAESFKAVIDVNPKYLDAAQQYANAVKNDNPAYYSMEAAKAESAGKLDRAITMYEKALEYPKADPKLNDNLAALKAKAGQIFLNESIELLRQDRLYGSFKKLDAAGVYSPALRGEPAYGKQANHLCEDLMKRANKFSEKEMWGNALVWLQLIDKINPDYEGLFQKLNEVRDPISRRVRKSIAVFDFGSPNTDKDAGKIAANRLLAYLHQNASVDLRIIERENLQSILREMQLSQTGLVDIKTAQSVGKMRGIDTFIMGDVLQFSARYTDNPTTNQVKVLVNEEDVRNPNFDAWLLRNPRPSEKDLELAPPMTTKKRDYQFLPNKQGVARINTMLEISYKLVDTQSGEIIANNITGKLVKEDKYQEGLAIAGIKADPLELPTEGEVLDQLAKEKIAEMGRNVLKHFQSLEVEYFNKGQDLQKRRNYEAATEKYTDAIFDEKLKTISTPISQKATELIELINKFN